jgi:hypothetical protein
MFEFIIILLAFIGLYFIFMGFITQTQKQCSCKNNFINIYSEWIVIPKAYKKDFFRPSTGQVVAVIEECNTCKKILNAEITNGIEKYKMDGEILKQLMTNSFKDISQYDYLLHEGKSKEWLEKTKNEHIEHRKDKRFCFNHEFEEENSYGLVRLPPYFSYSGRGIGYSTFEPVFESPEQCIMKIYCCKNCNKRYGLLKDSTGKTLKNSYEWTRINIERLKNKEPK